jgi:hypothetical protein
MEKSNCTEAHLHSFPLLAGIMKENLRLSRLFEGGINPFLKALTGSSSVCSQVLVT